MRTIVLFVLVVTAGILSANAKAGLIEIEIEAVRLTPIIENNVAVTTDGWLTGNILYDTMNGGFSGSLAWSGNRIDATGIYTVLYDVVNQPPGTEPFIRLFNEDWASADWQVTNMAKSLFLVFDGPIAAGELPFVLGSGEWVCNGPDDCDYYESGMEIGGVARAAPASVSAPVSVPEPGSLVLLALGFLALYLRRSERRGLKVLVRAGAQ